MFKEINRDYYVNTNLVERITIDAKRDHWITGDYAHAYEKHFYQVSLHLTSGKVIEIPFDTREQAQTFVFELNYGKVE